MEGKDYLQLINAFSKSLVKDSIEQDERRFNFRLEAFLDRPLTGDLSLEIIELRKELEDLKKELGTILLTKKEGF